MTSVRKARLEPVAFAVVAALALALLGVFVAVLAGIVPVAEPGGPAGETTAAEPQRAEAVEETEPASTEPTGTAAAAPPAPPQAVVTLVAARGDCWVVARRGGPDGEVLHEALVPAGERVTLRANRVWLQLGAAANVDVVLDGEPVPTGVGTVELLLPASGSAPS